MSKKNNHLQPAHYLKGFETDAVDGNPKVWVYKKGLPFDECQNQKRQNPQAKVPESTAWKKGFYSFLKDDGKRDYNTYENRLLYEFEELAQPVIDKIRLFEEIDENERVILFRYVASMITRGDYAKHFKEKALAYSKEETERHIFRIIKETERQRMVSQAIDEKLKSIRNSEGFVQKVIQDAEQLTEIIKDMKFCFLIAPNETPYFTGDNPVYYFSITKAEGEIVFPISSFVTLIMSWRQIINDSNWEKFSDNFWKVDSKTVEVIRKDIAFASIEEVYFSQKSKELVDFINNTNNNNL